MVCTPGATGTGNITVAHAAGTATLAVPTNVARSRFLYRRTPGTVGTWTLVEQLAS